MVDLYNSLLCTPLMCAIFPGYNLFVSLFSGIHFSCNPTFPFDPPTQRDTYFIVAWSTTQTNMEVPSFFYSCLHMVDDTKSCMGDLLV